MKTIPKNWTPEVFDVVEIKFLDHAEGTKPVKFVIYGRLSEVNSLYYVIDMWTYPKVAADVDDENTDRRAILRSTILRVEWLK